MPKGFGLVKKTRGRGSQQVSAGYGPYKLIINLCQYLMTYRYENNKQLLPIDVYVSHTLFLTILSFLHASVA